jgi:hypothetical protein
VAGPAATGGTLAANTKTTQIKINTHEEIQN